MKKVKTVKSEKVKSGKVESDTPRTDAAELWTDYYQGKFITLVSADFARELERENAWLRNVCKETRGLLDGAYDLVEIHGGGSPYNDKWRKNWMEKARSFGATPSL